MWYLKKYIFTYHLLIIQAYIYREEEGERGSERERARDENWKCLQNNTVILLTYVFVLSLFIQMANANKPFYYFKHEALNWQRPSLNWTFYVVLYYVSNVPHHCIEHSRGRILATLATYTLYNSPLYTITWANIDPNPNCHMAAMG